MYLFDTDVLSNIVKIAPSSRLLEKLRKTPQDLQFTTAISIGEIYYGASRSSYRERLIEAFEEKVFPQLKILAFDEESAKIFGTMKARLEKKGLSASEPDLRIASIALQHKLTLITGNEKHFENIPRLAVENWLGGD
jgi:tRNA(fMet)-specific endonuclease VapC